MSSLGQGYWERRRVGDTHTRDTGKKEKTCRSLPTASFSPVFALRVAAELYDFDKFSMGSIGCLVDFWHIFPHLIYEFHPNISPALCTSPQPSSIC